MSMNSAAESDTAHVAVIMGSLSDWDCMKGATEMLEKFDIPYSVQVVSAHRTPETMFEFASHAASNGIKVIIAGAGGAAHLPGMVASLTTLPVIGVPVKSNALSGLDSLYSIVQMPKGIPVATVAIGQAANAGILAARILSVGDSALAYRLEQFAAEMRAQVDEMNAELKRLPSGN